LTLETVEKSKAITTYRGYRYYRCCIVLSLSL